MKNKYLYHGSSIDGIEELIPQLSNHNKKYVYITDNYCLAIIYAYNPLPRPEGFFTYRFSKDGKLNYDEYFPNQLEKIYKNKKGFVYVVEDLKYKKFCENVAEQLYSGEQKKDITKLAETLTENAF